MFPESSMARSHSTRRNEMSIERNEPIRFHEKGTLEAVTRWIATHHDGIAEWLKNVRRQYQVDRANVAENHRVAALPRCCFRTHVMAKQRALGCSTWAARLLRT